MKKLISYTLILLLYNTAFSDPSSSQRYFIYPSLTIIYDKENKEYLDLNKFFPLIYQHTYSNNNSYKDLQCWWNFDVFFSLSPIQWYRSERQLGSPGPLWLLFKVATHQKTWEFACLVRHWPGSEPPPKKSFEGLLFFPAAPIEFDINNRQYSHEIENFKVFGKDDNNYQIVVPSACSITFKNELLLFQSIYGDFAINLEKALITQKDKQDLKQTAIITPEANPFVFFDNSKRLKEFCILKYYY